MDDKLQAHVFFHDATGSVQFGPSIEHPNLLENHKSTGRTEPLLVG
jgi:hypothetical protein